MKTFYIEYEYKVCNTITINAKTPEMAQKKLEKLLKQSIEVIDIYVQPELRQG